MIEFLSSLCILAVILDLAITISLCNMEFRNAGIEYAIKKVVGYSFLQRNKAQLIKLNIKNTVMVLIMAIEAITGAGMTYQGSTSTAETRTEVRPKVEAAEQLQVSEKIARNTSLWQRVLSAPARASTPR